MYAYNSKERKINSKNKKNKHSKIIIECAFLINQLS